MIVSEKINVDISKKLGALKKILYQQSDVVLAYTFGSYASGRITPLSDFDIALLLKNGSISKSLLIQKERILFSLISKALHTDEIDLIILNIAPITLQHSIIKNGNLLFCKDHSKKTTFTQNVVLGYLDTIPLRKELSFHLKERLSLN